MKAIALALVVLAAGCGKAKKGSSGDFPDVTPPLKAATPQGLLGASLGLDADATSLSIAQFQSNFFGQGPTVLFNITSDVDGRINFFNTGTTTSGCLTATPVAYTITPAGQAPITMYAQCYQSVGSSFDGDPGFIMIGKNNGITYVWNAVGAAWTAAMATPDGSSYDIHAWYSVGLVNGKATSGSCSTGGFNDCSYGVAEVATNAAKGTFEMAAAGIGIGYCGIQFGSDGKTTYAEGSEDAVGCQAPQTLCVQSSDEKTAATGGLCASATPFAATTAIGRKAGSGPAQPETTWTASDYPTTPNVTLDGTASDSVHFGPSTVPAGVTKF